MTDDPFPIVQVDALPERDEPIGSKVKFWFRREQDGHLWLFKEARPNTGEDWAEKLASELAAHLGLPHAVVELAQYKDKRGAVIRDFTDAYKRGALVHGNELLFEIDPTYPKEGGYRVHQHTLEVVFNVLTQPSVVLPAEQWPSGVAKPWDGFIGYILLDALIGNTDRHHQNWGVLDSGSVRELAPTFDHASSLGRELTDAERQRRLTTLDARSDFRAYVAKARSAFYGDDERTLTIDAAFKAAAARRPTAASAWLQRLETVTPEVCERLVARVPGPRMSDPARRFALAFLEETRARLETTVV